MQATTGDKALIDSESRHEARGNVQKKITPWSNAAGAVSELFPKHSPNPVVLGSGGGGARSLGLVLVATLLHKTPNVGGT